MNDNSWDFLCRNNHIPRQGTYREFLVSLFAFYRKRYALEEQRLALQKEQVDLKKQKQRVTHDTDSGLSPLVEAKMIQDIKLAKAREEEVHLKNLQTKKMLLDKQELYDTFAPILSNIYNILLATAEEQPNLQASVDRCIASLNSLGKVIVEQVEADEKEYIILKLDEEVDVETIRATLL